MTGNHGPARERFERHYIPEPNSGCWLWIGLCNDKGRGYFYYPPRNMVAAHVVSWELFRGARGKLHVLHACDNTYCVNPEHLHLGTHQENMKEREQRQRRAPPFGSKNGRAKFTEADIKVIRADLRWPRFIAKDWNTPLSTIQKIRQRITWKHVP